MLTPTRIRLVNVGIERPRFPDLIIDMRAGIDAEDVVIMLQNGGGKTTLISMWLHLYEPHRNRFLAKMAQRAQKKDGPPKEFDHYIPVGQTTYLVCEHAIPDAAPNLFGQVPRLVAGYAAWRDSDAQERAEERFFCFVSTDELTFDTLPLRSTTGQVTDRDTFFDSLTAAKQHHPTLQLADETNDRRWQDELRSHKFDLDFLRQFLLRMNVDEGATDRLFTYNSSRTFINSLVDILADDADIKVITDQLNRLRGKVASRTVNLATEQFLEAAIKHTRLLADSAATYTSELKARDAALSQWAHASHVVEQWTQLTATTLSRVDAIVEDARDRHDTARDQHRHLSQQHAASMVRRRDMELEQVRADLAAAEREVAAATHEQHVAHACTYLAATATHAQIKQQAAEQIASKENAAAPLRDRLATAAHALTGRYTAEAADLAGQRRQIDTDDKTARQEQQRIVEAQPVLAGQRTDARRDLEDVKQRRKDGEILRRQLGDAQTLLPGESGQQALDRHQSAAADARRDRTHAAAGATAAVAAAKRATADARALQSSINEANSAITEAELRQQSWKKASDQLGAALLQSGLIDIDVVSLDDHADILESTLRGHRDTLRAQVRDHSIAASHLDRNVEALHREHLLPPRRDVEVLAATVRAATNCTVYPGWQWLAALPSPELAEEIARRHPEVADGLVVAIDDDYPQIAAWLTTHSAQLNLAEPVVVTTIAAFQTPSADEVPERVVVLPDPAHWDKAAGQQAIETTRDRHQQALLDQDAAQNRASEVDHLLRELDRWQTEIGSGAQDRLATTISGLHDDHTALVDQQNQLYQEAHEAESLAEQLGAQVDQHRQAEQAALDHARGASTLATFDAEIPELAERASDAQARYDNAERQIRQGKERSRVLEQIREDYARLRDKLLVKDHDLRGRQTALSVIVTTHPAAPDSDTSAFDATSTDALREQVQSLQAEYDGLVTDDELRLTIRSADTQIDRLAEQLAALDVRARHDAQQRHTADPQRSQAAWEHDLFVAGDAVRQADKRRGELTERERGAQRDFEAAQDADGANTPLRVEWDSGTLDMLIQLQQQLATNIATATAQRKEAAKDIDAALSAQTRLVTFTSTVKDRFTSNLESAATRLAAAGKLGRTIDLADLRFQTDPAVSDDTDPATRRLSAIREALEDAADSGNLAAFTPALHRLNPDDLQPLVEKTVGDLDAVDHRYRQAEDRAHAHAEALAQCTRRAPKEAAAKIVDRLASESIDELIANATSNHHNASQRLSAVQSELRNFDKELDASVLAVKTVIETIRKRIKTTTRQSRLPSDPQLGRWAGQDFLRITWTEVSRDARHDQLRQAFARMITTEAGDQSPIHQLVEAITTNLAVSILIPKVPFDGTHYPIEQLSRRTSGGEGVTAGILIAALMQSMRANNPTFLIVDNIFAKVSEPGLLRLIQHVARGLRVQLILLTPSRDEHALSAFHHWIQLKIEGNDSNHTIVVPDSVPTAAIPQQLRRQALVAAPGVSAAVSALGMTSAVVSFTDPTLGATITPAATEADALLAATAVEEPA